LFVRYHVKIRGQTITNFGAAIHYLQHVLDDSLNRANKVAKRGSIKDDRFLTKFKKDMLIQLADRYISEVHDLDASLCTQIPRSKELALVEAYYDPTVLPNLSALAKSIVVTGYTNSGQAGHRGNKGRALMMHHGFISEMQYLGDEETVDNFIHNYGKTNLVGCLETKSFCNHRNPRMDTLAHLERTFCYVSACSVNPSLISSMARITRRGPFFVPPVPILIATTPLFPEF
jgi:hypothetical protein